jgi:hypothetical protein
LKLQGLFYDILVGIPGGLLIFMGMLMFNAVLNMLVPTGPLIMLVILCFTSLLVGMLARLMRPFHASGTAVAAGVVAALIILYLWRTTPPVPDANLVFGPVGMLVALGFSLLGAWLHPRLRKKRP